MADQAAKVARFRSLHAREQPLLLANAWDAGSARLFESLGFQALATTSGGHAASLGQLDYSVDAEQALAHAATIVAATDLPVSADLEDCFAADATGVADTIAGALEAGLAGCSIEDWDGHRLYSHQEAGERVAAAAQAAGGRLVLTARAENHLRGNPDLEDTTARLRTYEEAGADVLYAPALEDPEDLRRLLAAVKRPVNVLVRPATPTVAELAQLGVGRVSVGAGFAFAAYGAAVRAATELLHSGTHDYLALSGEGAQAARTAFAT
ncbi:MAG: isocitrate lyase/phosphoenolpyruvate mutase family protein [Solirubrobacterales bacterium]|nr:isocitrate lyase/phosphoenolpyruvate mutase family protein [Solirubrobacterales bacterium]